MLPANGRPVRGSRIMTRNCPRLSSGVGTRPVTIAAFESVLRWQRFKAEEEGAVSSFVQSGDPDGSADGAPKLIMNILAAFSSEERPRHQLVVPEKLEQAAMKIICSRACDQVDGRTGVPAILCTGSS